jgi:hypothetical protein
MITDDETLSNAEKFLDSEIYKNWEKYRDKYKDGLSEADIRDIKEQTRSINHEVESALSHNGRFGPLCIIEKLYLIQKRIAKSNETVLFEW